MKKALLFICAAGLLSAASISFKDAPSEYVRTNPSAHGGVLSYSSTVSAAKKSVVNIATSRTVKNNFHSMSPFNDPFFEEFFGFKFNMPQNQQNQKSNALGSGVIISNDGYIVTNNHVVEDSDEITVTMLDSSKEYKAKIIGTDPKTDLAIIEIEGGNFEAITFADSSKLLEGDVVFAIGNPFGVGGSVSHGIISGLNKDNIGLNQYEDFIQTDASINPGNSGGALVDSRGALVGINSAILSRSGGNNGIGFAIPSNMVKDIAQKLIKDGKITRGFIGVSIGTLTSDQKELYTSKQGALIMSVQDGSPAHKAGLKRGDLITKVNNKEIDSANSLKNFIGTLEPDSEIIINYERANKNETIKLKLANLDGDSASIRAGNASVYGLEVANLSDDVRRKYSIPQNAKGVVITAVKDNSQAKSVGFMKGDLIVQVNQRAIEKVSDLKEELANAQKASRRSMVWIVRGEMTMGLVLK